ncbi:extracellular solute-binding protein [Paenibacillus mucilaginosus]|uniref:Extracellular solute-binding protein family 1 n=1 Tax=Paenibacillus mucilaginosus (strain KNP414) TaxID=1036673 RepID=F8F6M2_PAEMK|nr:extracellular solute-binding protein [Paenibacillus mucilaginosus]AEI42976.1 extracellular solute-binding protein family 1 [Paenibacillus mucilaginosus KNP414]MCG7216087.1 extracellular solute-binding protein [Paenibacillus mucilaginosus]WDM24605.1 extracellular solute-binding protein [Paenibacillus mucilaginosus]
MSKFHRPSSMLKKAGVGSLSVTLAVLAGCSASSSDTPSAADPKASGQAAPGGPVKARWLVQSHPNAQMNNDMLWVKEVAAKTNVNIEWIAGPENLDQYKEKFNLTVVSGDIPDLMSGPVDMFVKGGEAGAFEPLNNWIDKAMPNFKKLLESNPEYARNIKTDDGNIYYIPSFAAVKANSVFIVRQDWLDKLGLKAPNTPDEMYNVLLAFKEKDPNGNGKPDEIPFTTRGKKKGLNGFIEPFGVSLDEDFLVENGKVSYTYTDPRMKEALVYLNKLFKEKLIDNEYATNDSKIWDQRLSTEASGMTWDVFVREDYFDKTIVKANPKGDFSIFLPLQTKDGQRYTKSQQLSVIEYTRGISSKTPHKEALAKWADWFYGPEGHMTYNFGILGQTYTMENNEPKYTDMIMKDPNNSPLTKMMSMGRYQWPAVNDIRYENASQSPSVVKMRDEVSKLVKPRFPKEYVSYTQEERDVINAKFTEISTFTDEMFDKFVYGAEPIDKFDEYAANIKKMGVDEVIKVQQAAYDRYMKR